MIDRLLRNLIWFLLGLRYRIRVVGLSKIAAPDGRGTLFLPNHPALIDPFILVCALVPKFRPRPLADRRQADRPVVRFLASRIGVLTLADVKRDGRDARAQIEQALETSVAALKRGESLLVYPAGRAYRQRLEDLGGNSAAELMLQSVPNARVVLVRTTGLWGSGFSYASGKRPEIGRVLWRGG